MYKVIVDSGQMSSLIQWRSYWQSFYAHIIHVFFRLQEALFICCMGDLSVLKQDEIKTCACNWAWSCRRLELSTFSWWMSEWLRVRPGRGYDSTARIRLGRYLAWMRPIVLEYFCGTPKTSSTVGPPHNWQRYWWLRLLEPSLQDWEILPLFRWSADEDSLLIIIPSGSVNRPAIKLKVH